MTHSIASHQAGPKTRNRWSLRVKLLALFASSLFGLLMVELALRILHVSHPILYHPDDNLGFSLRPRAAGWWRGEGGRSYVVINRYGMRDVEHATEKPANTIRIAVLGDSFAEALQVPIEKAFWSRLRGELDRCSALAGKKIEVLNFGTSGYGTIQEYIMLTKYCWYFDPDIVLLAFYTGNDICNNSKAFESEGMRPFFVLEGNRLVLDNSFHESKEYQARNSPAAYIGYQVSNYCRTLQAINDVKNIINKKRLKDFLEKKGLDSLIYLEPKDPKWAEAWQITEGVLRMMRDDVARHKARFFVVTLSNPIQVNPDPQVRREAMKRFGVEDLFYPDRRLKSFLEEEGVAVLNLAPPLQQYAERNKLFLHGFSSSGNLGEGHWNEDGHHLAGQLIAEWICDRWPDLIGRPPAVEPLPPLFEAVDRSTRSPVRSMIAVGGPTR